MEKLNLRDLQPSQFYISKAKVDNILKWFKEDLSNFNPIPIKELNGRLVMSDGHTRAVVALLHNIEYVPCVWEEEELSWDMYEACVHACHKKNIYSPYDLLDRIVDEETYKRKWDAWCDEMQKQVIEERENKCL